MSLKISILDSFPADQGNEAAWDPLHSVGDVALFPRTPPDECAARCAGAAVVLTNKVVLNAATIEALPDLQYIGVVATGTNVVDIDAARRCGIAVTNVPAYSTESVAQLVYALILHLASGVAAYDTAVKEGRWAAGPDFCFLAQPLTELAGKTLTTVGTGQIGGAVARIAAGFGMTTLAAAVPGSPSPDRVPLADALAVSDVVSLHCPLTPQTEGLVDEKFLAAMKPGAILINTGRGPLVDEHALMAALASGRLGGAALDVLRREPPDPGNPLLDPALPWAKRLVVTPHIGWATTEARQRLIAEAIANVAAFARGERRNRMD